MQTEPTPKKTETPQVEQQKPSAVSVTPRKVSFTNILQSEQVRTTPQRAQRVPLSDQTPKSSKKTPAKSQTPSAKSSSSSSILSPASTINQIFAPVTPNQNLKEEKRKSLPAVPDLKIVETPIVAAEVIPKDVQIVQAMEGDSSAEEGEGRPEGAEEEEEDICSSLPTPVRKEMRDAKKRKRRQKKNNNNKLSTPVRTQIQTFDNNEPKNSTQQPEQLPATVQHPSEDVKEGEVPRRSDSIQKSASLTSMEDSEAVVTPQLPRKLHTPLRAAIHRRRKSLARTAIIAREDESESKDHSKNSIRVVEILQTATEEACEDIQSVRKMPTPMKREIALKKKCFTPATSKTSPEATAEAVSSFGNTQRELFPPKLQTPLKRAIERGVELKTKNKLGTPIRRQIQLGIELKTKKRLNAELQGQIRQGMELKTKKKISSQLKSEIQNGVTLKTKKIINADLKRAIETGIPLRKKRRMVTPLRNELLKK